MKLSVLIATYNRRDLLARTLPRVLDQTFPSDKYEVIIVVDGSTDGTAEMLRTLKHDCRLTIIEQPNSGQAIALNNGLGTALGELVLFLDDDILCDRTLVEEHVTAHRDRVPTAVLGLVRVAHESRQTLATDWLRTCADEESARLKAVKEPRWPYVSVGRANTSAPRAALLACGGFDEKFVGSREDFELGFRLWKSGLEFCYLANATVGQIYAKSVSDLVEKDAVQCGRNEVSLCRKHPEYRPYSAIGRLAEGGLTKRLGREIGVRLPVSLHSLIALPLAAAGSFRQVAWVRRLGVRMLQTQMGLAIHRSALDVAGSWKALKQEFGLRLPVLLYHRISAGHEGPHPELTISPDEFDRQMRWLARRGYSSIRPSDWHAWCCQGVPIPAKPILITFDDAYADTAEYGFPILLRHGFVGAMFVITGQIGGVTQWDQMPMMTADQIKEWNSKGIEFGAHSRTHPDLTSLDTGCLNDEIEGSRRDLEHILGATVACFAHPGGCYNGRVRECVEGTFDLAFSCEEGINNLTSDPLLLRRIEIRPGRSFVRFMAQARLGYDPIQRVRSRIAVRTRLKRALRRKS